MGFNKLSRVLAMTTIMAVLFSSGCSTPLQKAARRGDTKRVQNLLDREVDLEESRELESFLIFGIFDSSRTPLELAVMRQELEVARKLLLAGANPNPVKNDSEAPLHRAVRDGNYDMVELLAAHGADPDWQAGRIAFLKFNHPTPLQYMLGLSAVADVYNKENGPFRMTELLLSIGAQPDARDKSGMTALHYIGRHKPRIRISRFFPRDYEITGEIVRLLLDAGADINAQDNVGNTPLHYAVRCNFGFGDVNTSVTNIFLKEKADTTIENNRGWTPWHVADERNTKALQRHLVDQENK